MKRIFKRPVKITTPIPNAEMTVDPAFRKEINDRMIDAIRNRDGELPPEGGTVTKHGHIEVRGDRQIIFWKGKPLLAVAFSPDGKQMKIHEFNELL